MKRLVLLALAIVMALSFAACSKDEGKGGAAVAPAGKTEVEKYVDQYGDVLVDAFESGFEGSGEMTCDSEIEGKGNDIVMVTRVNELDGLSSEEKQMMQEVFDSMNAELKAGFDGVEKELPSLENFIIDFCESDGDVIANIVISF